MPSLKNLIKDKLSGSHDYSHIERVLNNAQKINRAYTGNWKIIEAAILIHEIAKNDLDACKDYLPDFSEDEINEVKECIARHHDFIHKPVSPEAKIVQDADIIDMLGAIGIARGFTASGEKKYDLHTAKNEYELKRLNALTQLNLDESKKLAVERIEFTKLFFKTINQELLENQ